MSPMFIDGNVPLVGLTSVDASVIVTTPLIQHASGDKNLAVPAPTNNDTLVILTQTQTLSSKTFLAPIIMGGSIASANMTQPVVTGGVFTSPTLNAPIVNLTGGALTGGMVNNVIMGLRTFMTLAVGAIKTADLSTADIFLVQLTGACTLTVSNPMTGKCYQVILQQDIANSYTGMSWMTGFVNGMLASGPTQSTGAKDFWTITFDGINHYGLGAKDVQG